MVGDLIHSLHGLGLALVGLVIGVAMAAAVVRTVSGLLFDVHPIDAPTLTVTALVLLVTSALALRRP